MLSKLHNDLQKDEISFVVLYKNNIITKNEYDAISNWVSSIKEQPKRYKSLYKFTLNAIWDKEIIIKECNRYLQNNNKNKKSLRYKTVHKILKLIQQD